MRQAAALLCLAAGAAGAGYFRVDPSTGLTVDAQGRSRIFHGVNAVEKIEPFVPDLDNCGRQNSLCPEDMKRLAGWGMNVIRLGVLWRAVVPERRGEVNQTYLTQVRRVIDALEQHGIYTIVDMHQDVLSPYMCGEGMPDWAFWLALQSVGFDYNASKNTFPKPLPFSLDFGTDGRPNLTQCQTHQFASYYMSWVSLATWKALYYQEVMWDAFAEHWGAVAAALGDSTGVLAYELLNEPWVVPKNNSIIPNLSDAGSLLNLYKRCAAAIRVHDKNHIIMFEPLVLISYESIVGRTTDFPEFGVEGQEYQDRQVYAYHSYCPNNAAGSPSPMLLCRLIVGAAWGGVERSLAHTRLGGFLTEFGAAANDADSATLLTMQGDGADKQLQSWAYWTYRSYDDITTQNKATETFYNVDGSLQMIKIKALVRTYATAIAGKAVSMSFDTGSGKFTLQYQPGSTPDSAKTEVFVSPFYYGNGTAYTVTVDPAGAATWAADASRPGYLLVTHTAAAANATVTVNIA